MEVNHCARRGHEQTVNEASLAPAPERIDPKLELALFEHPHHLEALDRCPCRSHRLEAERRSDQALELAMVALKSVVQVLDLPMLELFRDSAFLLQRSDRLAIGRVLVGVLWLRLGGQRTC